MQRGARWRLRTTIEIRRSDRAPSDGGRHGLAHRKTPHFWGQSRPGDGIGLAEPTRMKRLLLLSPVLVTAACGTSAGGDASAYSACIQAETNALVAQRATASTLPQGPFAVGLEETNRDQLTGALREDVKTSMRSQIE